MIPVPREKITDWLREFHLPEPEYDVDITIGEKTIQFAVVFPDDQVGIVWGDQGLEQEWVDGWTIWICSNLDTVRVALLEISSRINGEDIRQEEIES